MNHLMNRASEETNKIVKGVAQASSNQNQWRGWVMQQNNKMGKVI